MMGDRMDAQEIAPPEAGPGNAVVKKGDAKSLETFFDMAIWLWP